MKLYELAQLLDVEHNFAFMPRAGMTFCNDYASVFCAARGARLPPRVADEQKEWLESADGLAKGWLRVEKGLALELANVSELVIAIVAAIPRGHVAPLVESPDDDKRSTYVSAAGLSNFIRCRLERSFGALQPAFFHFHPIS